MCGHVDSCPHGERGRCRFDSGRPRWDLLIKTITMNPEIQKKIDRIAALVRQRDAIDRELEAILGVEPVKPVEFAPVQVPAETPEAIRAPVHTMRTPSGNTVPRIARRDYDKEALEADIRAGVMKASTIADKHGVEVSTVYQIKSVMKKEGRLGPIEQKSYASAAPEEEDDEVPEELEAEEEESEDEDADEDDYNPLAYRGAVAGSEI